MAVSVILELLDLRAHLRVGSDFRGAVDLLRDLVDLVPQRVGILADESGLRGLLAKPDHDFCQLCRALAALAPVAGKFYLNAQLPHAGVYTLSLRDALPG